MSNMQKRLSAGLAYAALVLCVLQAGAFPPAPHHEIYGMVRGEDGQPLMQENAEIILETTNGVQITSNIVPNLAPGENYRLVIPMDAGVEPDPYVEDALSQLVPFRLYVVIGTTTNLPIEMIGGFRNLGEPGATTRIDLTLGVDSDGDGLPDSWEEILIAQLGGGLTLEDINPNDDSDNDGLSNLQEYIAGTFAFDPEDGFGLKILERSADHAVIELLAISGRTYQIKSSPDMKNWTKASFRIPAQGNELRSEYAAGQDVDPLVIEVPATNTTVFFRGYVQ